MGESKKKDHLSAREHEGLSQSIAAHCFSTRVTKKIKPPLLGKVIELRVPSRPQSFSFFNTFQQVLSLVGTKSRLVLKALEKSVASTHFLSRELLMSACEFFTNSQMLIKNNFASVLVSIL